MRSTYLALAAVVAAATSAHAGFHGSVSLLPYPTCGFTAEVPPSLSYGRKALQPEIAFPRGAGEVAQGVALDPYAGGRFAGQRSYWAVYGDPVETEAGVVQNRSILEWLFDRPQHTVRFLWGTPKQGDAIVFWAFDGTFYTEIDRIEGYEFVHRFFSGTQPVNAMVELTVPGDARSISFQHQAPSGQEGGGLYAGNVSFGSGDPCSGPSLRHRAVVVPPHIETVH